MKKYTGTKVRGNYSIGFPRSTIGKKSNHRRVVVNGEAREQIYLVKLRNLWYKVLMNILSFESIMTSSTSFGESKFGVQFRGVCIEKHRLNPVFNDSYCLILICFWVLPRISAYTARVCVETVLEAAKTTCVFPTCFYRIPLYLILHKTDTRPQNPA